MQLKTAAIYSIFYGQWKYNRKIYLFVFYDGPGSNKVHGLNLGCRELGTIGRSKLANIIARLSKVQAAKQWDGATLYRIFKTYLPQEVRLSYRTYFKAYISQSAIINFGFNSPDSFTDLDLAQNNKALYNAAGKDLFVKLLNLYTNRGVKMQAIVNSMAVVGTPAAETPPNVIEETPIPAIANKTKGPNPEIKGYY